MRCMEVLDRRAGHRGRDRRQTGLTSGAVTAMLDRLERGDWCGGCATPPTGAGCSCELTDKARRLAADIYGPLTGELDQFEKYSDDQLRLIEGFIQLTRLTLDRHAARVEQLRRDRDAQ